MANQKLGIRAVVLMTLGACAQPEPTPETEPDSERGALPDTRRPDAASNDATVARSGSDDAAVKPGDAGLGVDGPSPVPRDAAILSDARTTDAGPTGDETCLAYVDPGPNCTPKVRSPAVRKGRSAGCGRPAPMVGKQRIEACAGRPRDFILSLPANYDPNTAYPVIFAFHHAYGHMTAPFGYGGLEKTLGPQAIIISPEALSTKDKPCYTSWSRNFPDDLALFDALYDHITEKACVDLGKVYATGLSSGGFFSATLGCQRGDVLRGVMPVAGGKRDFVNCRGGVGALVVVQAKDLALREAYLKQNGCDATSGVPSPPDATRCKSYSGCRPEAPVLSCTFGHAWPSWATGAMWDFFQGLAPVL